jgi:hypothetical protein
MSRRQLSGETWVLLGVGVVFFAVGAVFCGLAYRAGQSAPPAVAIVAPAAPALPRANYAEIDPAPEPPPPPVFAPSPEPSSIFVAPRKPAYVRVTPAAPPSVALGSDAPVPPSRPIDLNRAPPKPSSSGAPAPASSDLAALAPMPGSLDKYDHFTAVYDLSAHTVYLPTGLRLEAHSGLGPLKDDPAHVNTPDRGATPPHMYDLTLREELFHGVQALRLNPVGGSDAIFGRAGLLAHTYMLGPNGDSNGCVSFKNYDAFLQAFQSGLIKRLAVVTSLR